MFVCLFICLIYAKEYGSYRLGTLGFMLNPFTALKCRLLAVHLLQPVLTGHPRG